MPMPMPRLRPVVLAAATALLAAGAAGCGADASGTTKPAAHRGYAVVSAATITPSSAVPAPKGPAVLEIRGRITNTNAAGHRLRFDMATLERLGVVQFQASDKIATGAKATFRGVLLSRLLAVAGADRSARWLQTFALNDYAVRIPTSDARRFPVLVATRTNGRRMPVAKYGPTRIVYPYGEYASLDPTTYDPRSIWQLKTIVVR